MDSTTTDSKISQLPQGRIEIRKSDYLELIKQYRKNIQNRKSFDITLHKSLKLKNEKNYISIEKENNIEKKIENNQLTNINKNLKETILTPPKHCKKPIIKTSPKKKQGGKIIYKKNILENITNKKKNDLIKENIENENINQTEIIKNLKIYFLAISPPLRFPIINLNSLKSTSPSLFKSTSTITFFQ